MTKSKKHIDFQKIFISFFFQSYYFQRTTTSIERNWFVTDMALWYRAQVIDPTWRVRFTAGADRIWHIEYTEF